MAQIIEGAGCGKNVLYREFPSKDDLVMAYLQEFSTMRARSDLVVTEGLDDDPASALVALTADLADRTRGQHFQGCAIRNYLREFRSPSDGGPSRFAVRWLRQARSDLDRLVQQLDVTDPVAVADQIWLIWEGLWSSAPHRRRGRLGSAGVDLVRTLVQP
jgi:AcrR family transcriptional regulator